LRCSQELPQWIPLCGTEESVHIVQNSLGQYMTTCNFQFPNTVRERSLRMDKDDIVLEQHPIVSSMHFLLQLLGCTVRKGWLCDSSRFLILSAFRIRSLKFLLAESVMSVPRLTSALVNVIPYLRNRLSIRGSQYYDSIALFVNKTALTPAVFVQ